MAVPTVYAKLIQHYQSLVRILRGSTRERGS
jgi:hypothetical protein